MRRKIRTGVPKGPQRSGTKPGKYCCSKNEKDENEISRPTEELLSAPKPVKMLWKPGRKYDEPRQRLEVFFRP